MALLAVAVLAGGIGVVAYATGLLRRSELQTIDARFSIRGGHHPPSNIVFVKIDVPTFEALERAGLHARFPFPRAYEGKAIEAIDRGGAKAIAVDIEFTVKTDPADDEALAEAIAATHGKVVLGTTEVTPNGETPIFGGAAALHELDARPAEVRLALDTDGYARRVERRYNHLGSFASGRHRSDDRASRAEVGLRSGWHGTDRLRRAAPKRSPRSPSPR